MIDMTEKQPFTLNPDRLAKFLVTQEIPDDWAPGKEQRVFIDAVVQAAQECGVLVGPGTVSLAAVFDEDFGLAFCWEYSVDKVSFPGKIVPLARTGSLGCEAMRKVLVNVCECVD